jgi:DNA polymerase elongation subunit (family B)
VKTGKKILSFKMNCNKCNKDIDNTFGINQLLDYLNDTYNSKVVKKEDRNIYLLSKLKTYRFNKKKIFDKNIIDVIDLLAEFYKNNNEKLLIRIKNVLKKIPNSKINNEIVFYNLRKVSQAHVILTQRMTLRDPGSAPQVNDRIQYCFIKVKGDSKTMLQGDLIENPDYINENDIPINYNYYIIKQIKNPLLQLFLHVDEDKAKKIFKNIQNLNKNKLNGQTNIMDFFKK